MNKTIRLVASSLFALAAASGAAFAEYPERPVTIIVPWPPGDIEDQLTRIIADEMTKETGIPTKVVNRPGGGGVEGATAVATAAPDGYTVGSLVIDVPTMHVIKGNATYTAESFEPVGIFLTYPFGLVALKDAPYNNLAELAEYAKSNPVRLGHFGYDLVPTMATFEAARQLGFEFANDTAYELLDCPLLKNGDADVINTTMALMLACLDEVKVIASYTDKPLTLAPDAQRLVDAVPGLDITLWNGLFVPAGTPQEVKDKLAGIATRAMESQTAKDLAAATGAEIYWMDAAASAERIQKDYETAERLVQAAE